MPDLNFRVESASAVARAAAPLMCFRVRVTSNGIEPVHVAALRCRIDIDAGRRSYTAQDRERLQELFGETSRWAETPGSLLWTTAMLVIPAFSGSAVGDLLVPCSFDFNVAATKYFHGLQEGVAPLRFEFSGQVVYESAGGNLESAGISDAQSCFELPISIWTEMMELYYPASVWLRLPRETFDRLYRYKIDAGIPTWEDVFERIVPAGQEVVN